MATGIICVILIIICVFGVKNYCNKLTHGCCGAGGDTVKKVKAADANKKHYPFHKTIHIEGMTCSNCAKRVENAFHATGDCLANVHLNEKTADIYMKKELSEEQLRQLVRQAGYTMMK